MPGSTAAPDGAPLAYSIRDAAALIGTSRSGIYRLAAEGAITPRRLGGHTVVLASDLRVLVDSLPPALIRVRPSA